MVEQLLYLSTRFVLFLFMANTLEGPAQARPTTIRDYINCYLGGTYTADDALPFATRVKTLVKGEVVTSNGQIEQYVYFLNSGLVQTCLLHHGEERIVDFYFPGDFFGSYASLLRQEPTDVETVALLAGTVEVIRRQDILAAYETSLLANRLGRFVLEQVYMRKLKREKDFLARSAEERYADLLAQQPKLVQHLPVDSIARYLGIHPSSLSRIRRQLGV